MIHTLTIFYAILLQGITVPFILFSPPLRVARLGVIYDLFPNHHTGALLMLLGVVLAVYGLTKRDGHRFLYFIPQWFFLVLTAGSALYHAVMGHYADGVIRSWEFIFVDQLPSFIAAMLYTFAIFDFNRGIHASKKR